MLTKNNTFLMFFLSCLIEHDKKIKNVLDNRLIYFLPYSRITCHRKSDRKEEVGAASYRKNSNKYIHSHKERYDVRC